MIKFQYNKIEYLRLIRELKIRQTALPTLKNKEAALRLEVHRRRNLVLDLESKIKAFEEELRRFGPLFSEFRNGLLELDQVELDRRKIAGVVVPVFKGLKFIEKPLLYTVSYLWFGEGVKVLKSYVELFAKLKVETMAYELLERERKKTTQKVNLYEKVQIPEFETAIRKIKRFLEDVENLDRASQKMMKKRLYEAGRL